MSDVREFAPVSDFFPELHAKSYLCQRGEWHFSCTCGFHSLPYLSEREAIEHPCEVEILLAESQERERRLYRSQGH